MRRDARSERRVVTLWCALAATAVAATGAWAKRFHRARSRRMATLDHACSTTWLGVGCWFATNGGGLVHRIGCLPQACRPASILILSIFIQNSQHHRVPQLAPHNGRQAVAAVFVCVFGAVLSFSPWLTRAKVSISAAPRRSPQGFWLLQWTHSMRVGGGGGGARVGGVSSLPYPCVAWRCRCQESACPGRY